MQYFISFFIILGLFFYGYYRMTNILQSRYQDRENIYEADIKDLLAELEFLMDLQMDYEIKLPYEGRDIKRITDFEASLKGLTEGVTSAISPRFIQKVEACGYNESFVYNYIVRGCTIRLLNYMKEENGGIVHDTDEIEE